MTPCRKIRFSLLFALACALAVTGVSLAVRGFEPSYRGQTISEWAEFLNRNPDSAEARAAVKAIGRPGVEYLWNQFTYTNSTTRERLGQWLGWLGIPGLDPPSQQQKWQAHLALRAIGPDAAPLIPRLISQLASPPNTIPSSILYPSAFWGVGSFYVDTQYHEAIQILVAIGAPARPELTQATRSTNLIQRVHAAIAIAEIAPDTPELVPVFADCLRRPSDIRQHFVMLDLSDGLYPDGRSLLLTLMNCAKSPDRGLRADAAYVIDYLGRKAPPFINELQAAATQTTNTALAGTAQEILHQFEQRGISTNLPPPTP